MTNSEKIARYRELLRIVFDGTAEMNDLYGELRDAGYARRTILGPEKDKGFAQYLEMLELPETDGDAILRGFHD